MAPSARYEGGTVWPEHLDVLARTGPFIAVLKMPFGRHMIIVDKIDNGLVHIRDPLDIQEEDSATGTEGTMDLKTFLDRWRLAANKVVLRR